MLWVVQNNLYNEEGYERFVSALSRLNINHIIVKPVPFTNIILPADFDSMVDDLETTPEPTIDTTQKIIICGATTLSRVAKAKGWYPGSYLNDNFDFSIWRDGFGSDNILNGDAEVGKVSNIKIPDSDMLFLRPVHDTKSFTGMVLSKYDTEDWLKSINMIDEEDEFLLLHRNTEIMISSAKNIQSEYRMFIVDGEVVTGSLYKRGDKVVQSDDVPPEVIRFTERMDRTWQTKVDCAIIPSTRVPAKAYVMDIAITPTGMKVIEINNINSAGFYAADVQRIIMAIEDMES